jgi:ATP-dependent DNA helicase RecQ
MTGTDYLENELKKRFNYPSFRTGQKQMIQDVLNGEDVLGVLPTGSGKSICYQLPAMLMKGVTIVVSPLISLMLDQVKQLRANHFKQVIALNSFLDPIERKRAIDQLHTYKMIYLSPELLQQEFILQKLEQLHVSLFVIDEAHCISQWGHEFRPDYLKLDQVIYRLDNPTTLALSATCPPHVQENIIQALNKQNMKKHIYPMDRTNITFSIEHVTDDNEKMDHIYHLLKTYQVPTLIYFNNRKTAEECVGRLVKKLPERRIAFYHGGMEPMDRIIIQQQFMNSQLDVICCTNAFGMGINKRDIRLIIHYHFPLQLESFIQEVGRAGRDGKQSVSLLLYSPKDVAIPNRLIQSELPSDGQVRAVIHFLRNEWKKNHKIHLDDSQIIKLFQMNETQWRFLYYQLEKHDMIKGNRIVYDEYNWKQAFLSIQAKREERFQYKKNKLFEMMGWINQTGCLRKHLYKGFQSGYSEPTGPCCSNCGFSWDEWKPEEKTRYHEMNGTWQNKLKNILLDGEAT